MIAFTILVDSSLERTMPTTKRVDISDTISDYEDSQEKDQLLRLQRKLRKEEVRFRSIGEG